MTYYHTTTGENYAYRFMPRLSCFSRIMNGKESPFYKMWYKYLKANDNILQLKPVKRCSAFLNENNTTTLNVYYKILYSPDKLRKTNFNSRMNLFLKYY